MVDLADQGEQAERRPYRRLWRDWLVGQRGRVALVLVLMIAVALVSGAYAFVIQKVVAAFTSDPQGVIWWGPALIVLVTFIKGAAFYAQTLVSYDVRMDVETGLKKAMFSRLVAADLARLQGASPAGLASRFSSEIAVVGAALEAISSGLMSALTVLAAFGVMCWIDWQIALATAAIFFVSIYPMGRIGRRLRHISQETQGQIASMTAAVSESLGGIQMARTYQLEKHLIGNADALFDALRRSMMRARTWAARIVPAMEVMGGMAVAALLCIVAWRLSRGTTTIADFMGLLTGLGVATPPARGLGQSYAAAQLGAGALCRVFSLLDAKNSVVDAVDAVDAGRLRGDIRFEDVGFIYPDGSAALSGVSFVVQPGSRVAFVGRSGAGKSTLFKLLPRLFDVTSGAIFLDGHDVRALKIGSLREQIALVSQDAVLLEGTVADNIGFGRVGASREQVVLAAKAAQAEGFISALPVGFDTVVSGSESGFSGGERQRLSIARAILRDAPILLLDEPTSALDAQSESAIQLALRALEAGRTTLIIAHRLATILDADKIVVMDGGRVVDQGSHTELLARGGLYADLYALQFAGG